MFFWQSFTISLKGFPMKPYPPFTIINNPKRRSDWVFEETLPDFAVENPVFLLRRSKTAPGLWTAITPWLTKIFSLLHKRKQSLRAHVDSQLGLFLLMALRTHGYIQPLPFLTGSLDSHNTLVHTVRKRSIVWHTVRIDPSCVFSRKFVVFSEGFKYRSTKP